MENKALPQENLEQKASKLLDEILEDKEKKEQLKESFIDLLLFGKAEFKLKSNI
jgi:hypothetical protein